MNITQDTVMTAAIGGAIVLAFLWRLGYLSKPKTAIAAIPFAGAGPFSGSSSTSPTFAAPPPVMDAPSTACLVNDHKSCQAALTRRQQQLETELALVREAQGANPTLRGT